MALLDADDEWEPIAQNSMSKIKELPDNFGLVACLDYKIGVNGERIPDRKRDSLTGRSQTRSVVKESIFPAQCLFAKCPGESQGFDTSLRSSEDRHVIRLSICALGLTRQIDSGAQTW